MTMKPPILTSDADAHTKLAARIADLETLQTRMKEANAAIRKFKAKGEAAQVAALVALGFHESKAIELLRPDFCGRIGFANYELTNNNANIRRLKTRLETVAAAQATPESTQESPNGIRLEDCPPDNRVRLFFPGKPDEKVRYRLKSNGFRWTPTLGCWQAYRNAHALGVASSFVTAAQAIGVAEDSGALAKLQDAYRSKCTEVGDGIGLSGDDVHEINVLAGGGEPDYGGVLAADGHVYSDADSGL